MYPLAISVSNYKFCFPLSGKWLYTYIYVYTQYMGTLE